MGADDSPQVAADTVDPRLVVRAEVGEDGHRAVAVAGLDEQPGDLRRSRSVGREHQHPLSRREVAGQRAVVADDLDRLGGPAHPRPGDGDRRQGREDLDGVRSEQLDQGRADARHEWIARREGHHAAAAKLVEEGRSPGRQRRGPGTTLDGEAVGQQRQLPLATQDDVRRREGRQVHRREPPVGPDADDDHLLHEDRGYPRPGAYDGSVLGADDPLPHRPRRVVVAGTTGSGKTTLAAASAPPSSSPSPRWTPCTTARRGRRGRSSWPTSRRSAPPTPGCREWQYPDARELLADRADTMVWLDVPTPVTLTRVVRRTVARRLRDEELWNGNKEAPLHTVFTDPEHIVRWAWRTRHLLRELVPEVEATHPQLVIVRLHTRSDVDRFITRLTAGVA